MTDNEPAPTTVRGRLTTAGLSDERIAQHMTAGRVRADGEPVTDPDTPAPVGTRPWCGRSDDGATQPGSLT